MKKIYFLALALILSSANFTLANNVNQDKFSTVTSDAQITREVAPDTATIRFYVENQGLNVEDLKLKNDTTVAKAITEIKKVLSLNETVKTVSYRINNIYSYNGKTKLFQKYEVTNGFEVKLKDLEKVSKVIQLATDNGVKRVENVSFFVEDGENICNSMLADVSKIAKNRASVIAGSLGTSLDKIKSVTPYCSLNNTFQTRRYNSSMMLDSENSTYKHSSEAINPGTINAKASINLTYYLK